MLQPRPNPKKVNFMAQTRTDPIIFYPIRNGPKHLIISPKLPSFGRQQTCEYGQKRSHNILQHTDQCPILAVPYLLSEAWFPFNSLWFSKFLEKICDTPVKNTPTGAKSLSPNRKYSQKRVPVPGLVSVRCSQVRGNSGFWVALHVFKMDTQTSL